MRPFLLGLIKVWGKRNMTGGNPRLRALDHKKKKRRFDLIKVWYYYTEKASFIWLDRRMENGLSDVVRRSMYLFYCWYYCFDSIWLYDSFIFYLVRQRILR